MTVTNCKQIDSFVGDDGAVIRELASPHNSPLSHHSLAEIRHPPGTASREHPHTVAEEVYYVMKGRGGVRVDDETHGIGPGDMVVIVPGQRHSVWQEGESDLVMPVTCVPAYSVEEVAFDEQPEGPGGLPERGEPERRD
jgi:mannose-6-phosphate isomerase-like protein (cupin superfamily)